ncbi:MAG: F0F1 ATP synthase subunit B [Eubacterium sp.]
MLKFDFNILWTIINLILFFLLIRFFLFNPIKKTIDKRNELIEKQFKNAEDANAAAEAKMADYESRIANVETEAEQIISDAKDNAKVEYGKIIDRAEMDAKKLKSDAQKQIEAETENARRAAKEQIASLAMQAAEKVVGANVSSQTNSDIFDEFLNESSVD